MDEVKLKSCPFCGCNVATAGTVALHEMLDTDDLNYTSLSKKFDVVCDFNNGGCGASTGKDHDTIEAAIKAWNRRVTDVEV